MPETETLDIWRMLSRRSPYLGDLVNRHRVVLSQSTTARCDAQARPSGWPTEYESWDTKLTDKSGQMLQQHEGRLSAVGAAPSNTSAAERKDHELRIGKIRGTVSAADLMTKHVDGQRLTTLCDQMSIKHNDRRPSSAPKLTIVTKYIGHASRALAAMTLLSSGSEREESIDRMEYWFIARRIMHEICENPDTILSSPLVLTRLDLLGSSCCLMRIAHRSSCVHRRPLLCQSAVRPYSSTIVLAHASKFHLQSTIVAW